MERIEGDTVDMSEWDKFEFHDIILYWDDRKSETKSDIRRCLGVYHHDGSVLCYYILSEKGAVRSSANILWKR